MILFLIIFILIIFLLFNSINCNNDNNKIKENMESSSTPHEITIDSDLNLTKGDLILSNDSKIQIGNIIITTGKYKGNMPTKNPNNDKDNNSQWNKIYKNASYLRFTNINDYDNNQDKNKDYTDIPKNMRFIDMVFPELPTNNSENGYTWNEYIPPAAILVKGRYLFTANNDNLDSDVAISQINTFDKPGDWTRNLFPN